MPPISLSLFTSSLITFPGRTRSGQYAILISGLFISSLGKIRSGLYSESQLEIFSVVPTGEVDSRIIKFPF